MKLLRDCGSVHRFWSVRLSAVGAVLIGALAAWPDWVIELWALMPVEVQALIPPRLMPLLGIGIYALTIVARLVRQSSLDRRRTHGRPHP
jgi:hypothetical protein